MKNKIANIKSRFALGSMVSIFILFLQMIFGLLKIKVLLATFGYEYYSIYQNANSVLAYLILLESGFSIAYLLKMYEPYNEANYNKIQQLYLGLSKMLHKVASLMLLIILVVSLIYPYIVAKNNIADFKIILLIFICGLKFVLPYFLNVSKKQILHLLKKSYLVTIIDSCINLLTDFIIVFTVTYTSISFIGVIFLSLLMLIPSFIIYQILFKKASVKLQFNDNCEPSYEASYMTKDILIQKVSYLVDNNIDLIIITSKNLFQSSIYSTYSSIITFPITVINQLSSFFRGYLGLKINIAGKESSYNSFRALLTCNFILSTIISTVFILEIQNFITLWIGPKFTADSITILLFSFIIFRKCNEGIIIIAKEAKDLFKESKNYTITAACLNVILSFILVSFYGINGLLIATLISDIFILDFMNLKLVFNKIFNKSLDIWKEIGITSLIFILTFIIFNYLKLYNRVSKGWFFFINESIVCILLVSFVTFILYFLFHKDFRNLVKFEFKKLI